MECYDELALLLVEVKTRRCRNVWVFLFLMTAFEYKEPFVLQGKKNKKWEGPEIKKKKEGGEKKKGLPDRESNPGLPRDRRRYWPLYYRGLMSS